MMQFVYSFLCRHHVPEIRIMSIPALEFNKVRPYAKYHVFKTLYIYRYRLFLSRNSCVPFEDINHCFIFSIMPEAALVRQQQK